MPLAILLLNVVAEKPDEALARFCLLPLARSAPRIDAGECAKLRRNLRSLKAIAQARS